VATQEVPALAVQVKVTLWPALIVVGLADMLTDAGVGFTTGLVIRLPWLPQPAKTKAPSRPPTPPISARLPSM
jgi:hypothetical protein